MQKVLSVHHSGGSSCGCELVTASIAARSSFFVVVRAADNSLTTSCIFAGSGVQAAAAAAPAAGAAAVAVVAVVNVRPGAAMVTVH